MKAKNKGQFIHKTDVGLVRVANEDRALTCVNSKGDVLLCVCDGLGGHQKGDYASQTAVDMLKQSFLSRGHFIGTLSMRSFIGRNLKKINHHLSHKSLTNEIYEGMGTTIVVTLLHRNKMVTAYVGDSRAYTMTCGKLSQLSEDQTLVNYQYNIGKIKEDEIRTSRDRHILMNALGIYPSVSYSIKTRKNDFDAILLCSDGVYNNVSDSVIQNILSNSERIEQKVDTIIGVAKSNGGSDNMAIAYWEKIKQ